MWKAILGVLCVALFVPSTASSAFDCPTCVLGLWDDVGTTQTFGSLTPLVPKSIYFGVQLNGDLTGLTGVGFSISGIEPADGVILDVLPLTPHPEFIFYYGNGWWAPVAPNQTGGMNIAWNSCQLGSQALFKLTLIWTSPISPVNRELRVRNCFPPTNPVYGFEKPVIVDCDAGKAASPTYSAYRVTGGSYVLNPVVQSDSRSWGVLKQLYR